MTCRYDTSTHWGKVSFIYKRKEKGQRQTEREELGGGGMGRKKKEKQVKPEVCWYYYVLYIYTLGIVTFI